jgi:hypothetical protein
VTCPDQPMADENEDKKTRKQENKKRSPIIGGYFDLQKSKSVLLGSRENLKKEIMLSSECFFLNESICGDEAKYADLIFGEQMCYMGILSLGIF